jgi:AcrR family transcriptional regulator
MVSERRLGSANSATRDLIIHAAVEVLQQEGGARLTASRIAQKAGVKAHLVHYYFQTMDELVIAVVRSHGEAGLRNSARALASKEPLRAIWDLEASYKWTAAATEFNAIGARSSAVQDELRRYAEEIRRLQVEAVTRHFEGQGLECPLPPLAIALVLTAIARNLNRERDFDVALGHPEMLQVVDAWLSHPAATNAGGEPAATPGAPH